MTNYMINIFVRVVKRKMNNNDMTADEILNTYPSLTEQDAKNIKVKL